MNWLPSGPRTLKAGSVQRLLKTGRDPQTLEAGILRGGEESRENGACTNVFARICVAGQGEQGVPILLVGTGADSLRCAGQGGKLRDGCGDAAG